MKYAVQLLGLFGLAFAITMLVTGSAGTGTWWILGCSIAIIAISLMTNGVWGAIFSTTVSTVGGAGGLAAKGYHHATPHIGKAARATARSGAKATHALWEGFWANAVFWIGVFAACVAIYFFGSAYLQHSWQKFHAGLFATMFSLFCFATKYNWWKRITETCVEDKKGRVWTWLGVSLVGLTLSFIHTWWDAGVISLVSTIAASITLLGWWKDVWVRFKSLVGAWFGKYGWGVAGLSWAFVLFVVPIAIPIALGHGTNTDMTRVTYTTILLLIVYGVVAVGKKKIK